MNEKKIAKRYLLSLFGLYFAGAVLLTAFMFALRSRTAEPLVTVGQTIAGGLLLPLIPCVSYAGFVMAFMKVGELTKKQMILIVVLYPLVLVALTLYGVVMLVPSVISAIKVLSIK
ncbi:MAG: hypothetical protein IJ077_01160 [Eubacterium sp.]|nr:hypothetical protein [Eubacterium sp.]MBR1532451.1 hypothetical protein [Eubacterium sp.]